MVVSGLTKYQKKDADNYWVKFSCYLVGYSMCPNLKDMEKIVGLSISPKNYNTVIKIWNCDSSQCQSKGFSFNPKYGELTKLKPLYKKFSEKAK